jgi:hypothetical protein
MVGEAGLICNDTRDAGVTFTFALACNAPTVALSFAWPGLAAVARPTLVTLTMPVLEDAHAADVVKSLVVPSL